MQLVFLVEMASALTLIVVIIIVIPAVGEFALFLALLYHHTH